MNITTSLDQIPPSACPSIQYRIRKEILHQSSFLPEMIKIRGQIMQDEAVKKVLNSQGSDGWLGWAFHGYDSLESGIRLLCEKGVEANEPVLACALLALEKHTERLERGLGKAGRILDDLSFGGAETIRAYLFAHAGFEDNSFVKEQIKQALQVFNAALQVKSLKNLCLPYKDRLIFREGICWPSIYHLRLLAMSQSWRTPENSRIITQSIQNIVRLSPIPYIHIKHKSRLIAPASFGMNDFTPNLNNLTDPEWMQWFHRMELLARLGVVEQIPGLKRQVQVLTEVLQEGKGLFTKMVNHPYFHKWGSYTGIALEKDWRNPQRRINDLTFRSVLILHYADQ